MGEMMVKAEKIIEIVLLLVFFAAILYLGPGTASEHRITHDFPTGYGASDAYQHQSRAEAIKQMGQYRNEAPYMMAGLTDVVGFYPPILYHAAVLLSDLSGLPSYDALFLVIGLALALAAMITYYLARNLGKLVAMLALPLTLFAATGKPFLGMVTFGQMPFALSSLFLLGTAWAITKLDLPRSYFLIPIFLAGSIMTHTSETLFFFIMVTAVFAALLLRNVIMHKLPGIKKVVEENKKFILALAIAAVLTIYFWPLFIGIWLKMQPYHFSVETVSASFPAATVFLKDFGFMLAAVVAGLIAAVLFAVQKRKELGNVFSNPKLFTLLFSAYMLLAGLGTYAGFGLRSFQTRLFWPITLAPLAGFGIYQLINIISRSFFKKATPVIAAVVVMLVLSAAILSVYYKPNISQGMTKEHWDAMRWIAENTPKEARIYVLYSQLYSQTSTLYNTERVNYFLELKEFSDLINNAAITGKINRTTRVTYTSDSGAGLPYRKGPFSFGQHVQDTVIGGTVDICSAEYYLIDKALPDQMAQANNYLLQKFVKANMTAEYQNNYVTVLKNNNIGGDCVA